MSEKRDQAIAILELHREALQSMPIRLTHTNAEAY